MRFLCPTIEFHFDIENFTLSTKMVTNQPSDAVCALGVMKEWAGVDPEVAVKHRDETCSHGVAFRTAISMESMMSEGVASSHPLRL